VKIRQFVDRDRKFDQCLFLIIEIYFTEMKSPMDRLLIKIIPDNNELEAYDKEKGIFHLSRSTWKKLKKVETGNGFFARLGAAIDVKCPACGSFSVSSKDLFYAITPDPKESLDVGCCSPFDEALEGVYDDLWDLLNIITEEKLQSDSEWQRYQDCQLEELKLLYTLNGELIYREEGYPLGLTVETVFFKISKDCERCSCYIR